MRDGRKYNGIVSLNLLTPWNRDIPDGPHKVEENITPGTVVKVEIGIWAMGVEYEAGEELRFVVSGRSKAVSSFCSNDAVNKNGAYKIDYAVNIRAL
ncbi:hypothetical protein ACKVV1_009178 [Pyricularia oryzae]